LNDSRVSMAGRLDTLNTQESLIDQYSSGLTSAGGQLWRRKSEMPIRTEARRSFE